MTTLAGHDIDELASIVALAAVKQSADVGTMNEAVRLRDRMLRDYYEQTEQTDAP